MPTKQELLEEWRRILEIKWRRGAIIQYQNRNSGEIGFVQPYKDGMFLNWATHKYFYDEKDCDLGI